jgi:outer membrane protein assembly factor BamB
MSDTTPPADTRSLLRRFRVPLIAFALPIVLLITVIAFDRFDLAESFPEASMPLFIGVTISTELAILVVAVWFLFFSGYRLVTKVVGCMAVLALATAVYSVPRRWEFGGMMTPIPIFRWEPDLRKELDERLAQPAGNPVTLTAADLTVGPDDFPRYRGPAADGVASPVAVRDDWSANPPKRIWRTTVGWSYAGVAVAGKVAVTLEQRKDTEAVVCYDRADGKELWRYLYPAEFKHSPPMGGGGPRSTPTIADGDVYTLGAKGDLVCLDGTNGKPRWSTNVVADNGAKVVEWGMTSSPLIAGNLVVVNAGIDPGNNQHQAVAAYDRQTGKKAWAAGDHAAGYSSPMLVKLANVEQIVLFDAGGVAGIAIADGRELWRHVWTTFSDMNIIQPLVLPGDRVFISSELSNGCALLQIKKSESGWSAEPIWANKNMGSRFANPVHHAGHIYGLSNNFLVCLDAKSGKRLWKGEQFDSGQLLVTGDTLLVQAERTGELVAVATDPAGYRELGRIRVLQGSRTWNTFALAGGWLYMRNHEEMVCYELPK